MEVDDDDAEQERLFAARLWSRLASSEEDRVASVAAFELLEKLGLPVHLVSQSAQRDTQLDFKGFRSLITELRAAVVSDPERVQLEQWFDTHSAAVDAGDGTTFTGVSLDLLVQLPALLGYAAPELDEFLRFFPTVGGRISKENVLAGFLRARESLHKLQSAATVSNVQEEQHSGGGGDSGAHEVLQVARVQRQQAEENAAALKREVDEASERLAASAKKVKTLEARVADMERELKASAADLEQLQREHGRTKREAGSSMEMVAQLKRDAERVARETAEARAKDAAEAKVREAVAKANLERARSEDSNAALLKAQEDLLGLMEEKGRLAALVEKLIQTNRRLEESSREDQEELKAARALEAQLRHELEVNQAAAAGAGAAVNLSLESELASTSAPLDTAPAPSVEELARLQGLVNHYSSEYVRASDAVLRLQNQLEHAFTLLDEKSRAIHLLTDGSLELTGQLRAIERDRLSLVSQLKDRERQLTMMKETVQSYSQQTYAFDANNAPGEEGDAQDLASVSAAVATRRRRRGWLAWCCRPLSKDETRYTRLL